MGDRESVTTFEKIGDVVGTGLLQDRFLTLIQAVVVIVTRRSIEVRAVHEEIDPRLDSGSTENPLLINKMSD